VRTPAFCVDVLARGRTALGDAAQRSALSVVGVTFLPPRRPSGYAKSQATSRKPLGRGVNAVLVCQLGLDPLERVRHSWLVIPSTLMLHPWQSLLEVGAGRSPQTAWLLRVAYPLARMVPEADNHRG
jgi:hypothetical protein